MTLSDVELKAGGEGQIFLAGQRNYARIVRYDVQ